MANLASRNHVERVLAAAQDMTATTGEPGIATSWRRCLVDHKLDPARRGPPRTLTQSELKDCAAPIDALMHLAMPELEDLYRVVREAGYCVNLADTNATVLVSRLPEGEAATILRKWKVYTGSVFSEATEGTNGLGTALAEQRPILVHRDEHFREQWAMFSCAVAPVFDHTGQLTGAVNITSCRGDLDRTAHQMALAVTAQTVRRIEDAIFRAHFRNAWIAALPGHDIAGSQLIAFDADQRVLGASRAARRSLGLSDSVIDGGAALSQFIRLDADAMRSPDAAPLLRHADGTRLGHGRLSAPQRARSTTSNAARARHPADHRYAALSRLAGSDPALQRSVKRLMLVADENIPVLLHGETGSGKDMFARAIHAASHRAPRHYVALNCAALPESLIDAELFGYEAGAFTGARRDGSKGLIVQADGGTLFLDEIGDMPLALQTRLLRVLENREVWPLGALKPVPVNIRLISATHRDLDAMVAEGGFRADLYYRIRGLQVELPALRARSDKAEVIAHIAAEEAPQARIASDAWKAMLTHPFPGNMRQLRHVLRLAACTAEHGVITEADLDLPPCGEPAMASDLEAAERNVIAEALRAHGGRVAATAQALNLSRATLYRKIKALKIESVRH
ncbi:MAG: sigma-54-dependent Fis family transcriptional regulator [Rhizobiales bacterium 62-47]|nr:sigma-54-dependent Fis family transcriptional regulator [Hyphomicrobiales bacterium]OJY13450.1 MAG: sigma-54-dependent Fis family transcriptional regulator [Rhizobiales bacterium 62-47]